MQTRGVDTIKEVSSEQENNSPSDSGPRQGMGTIMQTASLSAGKKRHADSAHFTQSQKGITASDFKDMNQCLSSSKTDSNMTSLAFRPSASEHNPYHQTHSISINSNQSKRTSSRKMRHQLVMQGSHPSFGGQAGPLKQTSLAEKWGNLADKLAARMLTKDIHAQLSKINDVFQRKLVQQEVILINQSHMQLKSFLEISMNSQQNNPVLSASEREIAYEELRDKSQAQMQLDLSQTLDRLAKGLCEYFKGETEILQAMAQERERNIFLEAELSAREDRLRPAQISADSRDEDQDQ